MPVHIEMMVHEARHAGGAFPHTCGGPIARAPRKAPSGVQYYTMLWLGIELGLAGAVIGASAAGTRHRRLWAFVALAVTGCVVATVALQSIGWAPAIKMN